MSEWISIKDRLPETGDMVIALSEFNYPYIATFFNRGWCHCDGTGKIMKRGENSNLLKKVKITHWMPLLEAPK